MKVAVAKYAIGAPRSFEAFAERIEHSVELPLRSGAQLLVFPEYLSLELAASFDSATQADLAASLSATQRFRAEWLAFFAGLAQRHRIHMVAGSFLLRMANGRYRNRSDLFTPEGGHEFQDKLRLTGFEKSLGLIESGDALKVFELGGLRAAIAVCYDSEFPLPVRAQCEAGARLLIVPSCTDTAAGATRVRVGCLARALENRCFVAQSVTAGDARWSPALDTNTGEAALLAPMDVGLPADGVLVETGATDAWAIATLDIAALEASRAQAQVANDRDWPAQYFPTVLRAQVRQPQPREPLTA